MAQAGEHDASDLDRRSDGHLRLYKQLLLIRRAEERLVTMFANGEIPGFIHLSIGQEAVSVGVMSALEADDTIASTHRGHGHALAKGLPLQGFFAELLARDEGLCRGRGGSMHVADRRVGMLGANGIVGAGLSIALGSALAHKRLDRPNVAVAFFGDGALAEGLLHECLNMAALWRLPMLFVCENNGWSEFQPSAKQVGFKLADLAGAHGIPYVDVDGNDVLAVAEATRGIIAAIRSERPHILNCTTTRVRGHFEGDAQKYRDRAEIEGLAERDPLTVLARQMEEAGVARSTLEAANRDIEAEVDAAAELARAGAAPDFAEALADVYETVETR